MSPRYTLNLRKNSCPPSPFGEGFNGRVFEQGGFWWFYLNGRRYGPYEDKWAAETDLELNLSIEREREEDLRNFQGFTVLFAENPDEVI